MTMRRSTAVWILGIAILLLISGLASGQTPIRTHLGQTNTSGLGSKVSGLGDIDGDGVPDYSVSALGEEKVWIYSGVDGHVMTQLSSTTPGLGFGLDIEGGSDVTQDGVPDLLVSDAFGDHVFLYSGATLQVVHTFSSGLQIFTGFGQVLRFIGDVNGDGVSEVAIALAYGAVYPSSITSIWVYDGVSKQRLYVLQDGIVGSKFGWALSSIGDINSDMIPDIVVGAGTTNVSGLTQAGAVHFYSGASGTLLFSRHGDGQFYGLGGKVCGLDDMDSDGLPDYASTYKGNIRVFSTATAQVLSEIDGKAPVFPGSIVLGFGGVVPTSDLDGDGRRDIITSLWVSGPQYQPSAFIVASSATGSVLYRRDNTFNFGINNYNNFPTSVCSPGDVDGDSLGDWIISCAQINTPPLILGGQQPEHKGWVEVLSRRALFAKSNDLTNAEPVIQFDINASIPNASKQYFLLASYSGTNGIPIGAQSIPLTYDWLTETSIVYANSTVFQNTFGTTDAKFGKAVATFDGTLVPPAASGLQFSFAYVLLGPHGYVVSNPEQILINVH